MEAGDLNFMIKELAVSLYTELDENDKPAIGKNINEVLKRDPRTTLSHLQDLFNKLNKEEKDINQSENFKIFQECEKYQRALQKLDLEVRNHFKHELQMKVYIDSVDDTIKNMKTKPVISNEKDCKYFDELSKENKKIQSLIYVKNREIDNLKSLSISEEDSEYKSLKEKVCKQYEKILEQEKQNKDLMRKYSRLKIEIEGLVKLYEKHKEEFLFLIHNMTKCQSIRAHSRSNERQNVNKESIEIKTSRNEITPNRQTTQIPKTYKQKISNIAKAMQSTKKNDISPLSKFLQIEQSKCQLKPAFHICPKKK